MEQVATTDIQQIEIEINFYKEQTARNIIKIGKRLLQAKELIPYGEWGKWLETKVDFSQSLANKFMKVATEFADSESIPKVGLSKLIMLTTVDQEERQEFIENNPVEDMTTRELRQAIKEKKELEKKVEELENQEPKIVEKEIIKEVVPIDYEELKTRVSKKDYDRLRKEYTEKANEAYDLKKQMEQMAKIDSETEHQEVLKDNVLLFCTKVHKFINEVGGFAWLTDYLKDLDDFDRNSYVKAINLMEGWILTVKSNINKEENKMLKINDLVKVKEGQDEFSDTWVYEGEEARIIDIKGKSAILEYLNNKTQELALKEAGTWILLSELELVK